jgi:hypothetical protein
MTEVKTLPVLCMALLIWRRDPPVNEPKIEKKLSIIDLTMLNS